MQGRQRLMVQALRQLEERFGSLESLVDPSINAVATLNEKQVTATALEQLFAHKVSAVRVPNFFPKAACDRLADTFLQSRDHGWTQNWKVSSSRGMESSDVESIGSPYNVALGGGPEALEQYFQDAKRLRNTLRQDGGRAMVGRTETPPPEHEAGNVSEWAFPTLTPIDLLRLQLDEVWPDGATVGKDRTSGRALLAGAGRIMSAGANVGKDAGGGGLKYSKGFCHVDDLSVMSKKFGLFSANVYLQTPPFGGGELEIWPINIKNRFDFLRNSPTLSYLIDQDPAGQEILRAKFPRPLVLTPEQGELILICAQRPHAAAGFTNGTRVSMQTFISHDAGEPLVLDN